MCPKTKNKTRFPILKERLNELMGDMNVTEFAEKVGLTRQTMGAYLNGNRIPDSLLLKQIAQECNVSADWLLGLSGDRKRTPTAVNELGLSETSVENILFYANSHGFEDCLPGLNLLIEHGSILSLAALVYRFRNFVMDARKIERSYSKDAAGLDNAVQQRDTTNQSISERLEQMICNQYPYLKGHFRVLAGASAVRRGKEDLVRSFDETISKISGYNSYMDEISFRNTH